MKVSVICNTCNRANHLRRLLIALSKQTYDDFEVIVVNGPSEDNTGEVIKEYSDAIKSADCPVRRLGVSRNIGISNAAGDICVFIDDDAIPGNKYWLETLVEYYKDPMVGGVGGPVYNLHGGIQFKNGYVDVWGIPHAVQEEIADYNDPYGERFGCLMGCNCSFRSNILKKVGGFDEFYDYFHDESDVSVRVIKAGYKIKQNPDAYVFHEKALGHARKDEFHWDWYTIIRSQVYFGIVNSDKISMDLEERIKVVKKIAKDRLAYFRDCYEQGFINENDLKQFNEMWKRGVKDGIDEGVKGKRTLLDICEDSSDFKKYAKNSSEGLLNIVMLCENFNINDARDGIASYTVRLAKDYAAMGHCVHVITNGKKASFNLLSNVNVHVLATEWCDMPLLRGKKTLNTVLTNSYEVMKKIAQLDAVFCVDVIESPLWNSIGLLTKYILPDIPLCIRLETPLKMVVKTQQWKETAELKLLERMEYNLLNRADGILYISDSIKETVESLYGVDFSHKAQRNYLGIEPQKRIKKCRKNMLRVFFIGRLERRKGVHNLLSIIPELLEQYPAMVFHIAGDDSLVDTALGETFRRNFERMTNNKYVDRVLFLGKISNEEKEEELKECDIFVAPSLYESFGIVFIEAMSYGKPVIGCEAGGMKEIVENNVTGLLVEPDNPDELKLAMIRMIEDPELRRRFGENALARVMDVFDNMKTAKEAVGFYKNVIDRKKKISTQSVENIIREIILYRQKILFESLITEHKGDGSSELLVEKVKGTYHYFPWKNIRAGESVIIYGGGKVCKEYMEQLRNIPYCNVIAICDRNPDNVRGYDVPVINMEELEDIDEKTYDRIIIAIHRKIDADSIIDKLLAINIPRGKILWNETI